MIEKSTSKKLNLEYENDVQSYIENITADNSKITKILDWKSKLTFKEGLQKLL